MRVTDRGTQSSPSTKARRPRCSAAAAAAAFSSASFHERVSAERSGQGPIRRCHGDYGGFIILRCHLRRNKRAN